VVRRTAASSALAASVGGASLCVLALHLNPEVSFGRELVPLVLCLFLPWALGSAVVLAMLAGAGRALRWWPRPFRPVVDGHPHFVAMTLLALAFDAALYWYNLFVYGSSIPVPSVRALAASAVAVTAAAVVLFAIGLDVVLFPGHGRPLAGPVAILASGLAVAVPLALRPPPPAAVEVPRVRLAAELPSRHVVVIGIDGLSPSDLAGEPSSARVPALARLARRGAFVPLTTLRPAEGPPVWATLMTGRLPRDHGVRSASTYRLLGSATEWPLMPRGAFVGLLERARLARRLPVTSTARRRRALWDVLDAFDVASGLVDVWGTHPPEKVKGFVLSPYFHLLRRGPSRGAAALYPADLLDEVRARAVDARDVDPAILRELAPGDSPGDPPLADPLVARLAGESLAPDLTYERAADVLRKAYDPSLLVVTFHGYDLAGHVFFRYAHPEAFGNVSAAEQRRYGRVLPVYAGLLGRWAVEVEKSLRPGDVLLVVSGHGLAPTPLWRRLLGALTGAEPDAASHAGAPPGVLVAVGDDIEPGTHVRGAAIVDVAPTILYLLGLPVARDMEGRALTEIVTAEFADENPLTFIPSYESLAVTPSAAGPIESLPPLPEERP
jgi:predicted AlkP superfamily phosphohydrolase/phosphomutase